MLSTDIGNGAATVLAGNAAFTAWEFHAGFVDEPEELAETKNQNIAAVMFQAKNDVEVHQTSARTEYVYDVEISIYDRADADSNTGPLSDAICNVFSPTAQTLYSAITDSGSNLLDGTVQAVVSAIVWVKSEDTRPASKRVRRTATFTLTVTAWRLNPEV